MSEHDTAGIDATKAARAAAIEQGRAQFREAIGEPAFTGEKAARGIEQARGTEPTLTIPEPRPARRGQFRNIVDWRLDGDTRWTILHVKPEAQYRAWGARGVVYFSPEDRRAAHAAMLLLDDGAWYYAHAETGTAWCDMGEGYAVATGEQAIAAEAVHRARRSYRHATEAAEEAARKLGDAIAAWRAAFDPYQERA